MEWVHCNSCAVQPGEVEKKFFFITSCGHIYCNDCFHPKTSNECRICQSKCNTILLSSNLKPEIEIYFDDPIANFKKHMRILEFQHSQRLRLISLYREKLHNYKALKKEHINLVTELKVCKEENQRLREEIKQVKMDFNEFKKAQGIRLSNYQMNSQQRTHSFSQYIGKESSKLVSRNRLENSFPSSLKRPTESNFFFMTEKKPESQTLKKECIFTPPDVLKHPGDYRSYKTPTSDLGTPSTPETISKRLRKINPLQRRIDLPSGPTPSSKLRGLHLSIPTSTPKKECTLYEKLHKH